MMKLILSIVALIGIAGLVVYLSSGNEVTSGGGGTPKTGVGVGDLAPDFELPNASGETVKLSDFRGKSPVFVNFWATWCPFCVDELPLMANVQSRHDSEYVTIAINRGETVRDAQEYLVDLGVTDAFIFLYDTKDIKYSKYQGFAMPYSLFIDVDGVVADKMFGPLNESNLEIKLGSILNK